MSNWLWRSLLMASFVLCLVTPPAEAEGIGNEAKADKEKSYAPLLKGGWGDLAQLDKGYWGDRQLAQSPIQVTGVRLNPTETGIEVILETPQGKALQPRAIALGKSYIANIPNTVLALPQGQEFRQDNPASGITRLSVTQAAVNNIRVTVTGATGLPAIQLFDSPSEGLIFAVASAVSSTPQGQRVQPLQEGAKPGGETDKPTAEGEETEIVVTGEQEETGYNVPEATTATRTDTPLRDIPQSIQVVPQEVLRDQQVNRLDDALRNVSGVTQSTGIYGVFNQFTIRGFSADAFTGNILRDGLRDPSAGAFVELPNIERVEVLRGPASVLYGFNNPGGTINLITKQPLSNPFYFIEATTGSYDFYRGVIDLSGPLNNPKTVLYRLNASYRNSGSFIDFFDSDYLGISPVVSFAIGERTSLSLEGEYADLNSEWYSGLPLVGTVLPNPNGKIPRDRNFGEPSDNIEQTISRIGYRLEHKFSNNWSFRNAFRATFTHYNDRITIPISLRPDNQTLNRLYRIAKDDTSDYIFTTDFAGKFSTGSIEHQLLIGVDLTRYDPKTVRISSASAPISLFNPVYDQPPEPVRRTLDTNNVRDSLGIYVQDRVTLAENLKLLLGLRFDALEQRNRNFLTDTRINQSDNAFSPRIGIVYQPLPPISLYASYARSFIPAIGVAFDGSIFQPERGTQFEIGVKADLNDRLSATLALYDLTRSNVLTDDPNNPNFDIQTGKQNSQGIEFNISGEILPGWNIIAGYAYTDARIEQDETYDVGNFLNNTPKHAFNLWTTYEIQEGTLQGLGLGLGFFFVGDRQGDLNNTFEVPSYFRTDAAIFYKRENFRAALNFKNLFDIDYFENAFNNVRLYSGQPFTVQGTISWEF